MPTFNLADLWETLVDAGPDAECLVSGLVRHTRLSLDYAANRLGHLLQSLGVGQGHNVGVYSRNRSEFVETMFACWKIGAVPVNVNWRYTASELRPVLADAGIGVVVAEVEFLPVLADVCRAEVEALPRSLTVVVLPDDAARAADRRAEDSHAADSQAVRPEPLSASPVLVPYDSAASQDAGRKFGVDRSGDDLHLLYTGGTTGAPKGVMWRHEDYFFACASGGDPARLQPVVEPSDISAHAEPALRIDHLVLGPLMHASGQWTLLVALYSGCKAIMPVMRS
ncbi:MAG TPA: AMP-binding protein, partial [Acidimicrobiales bacterium]|nr:AMP-binding protein [Acidimicrobiales bacterium]